MTRLFAAAATRAAAHTVHRVTPADAARMRALRLEMLADSPLAFLETLAQAAARSHDDYRRRIAQASAGSQLAQFVVDPAQPDERQPIERQPGSLHEPDSLHQPGGRMGEQRPRGRLLGHAGGTVLPEEPGCTVIFAVYVTPTSRGQGLLAEMVDAVAEWSLAAGRKELMLEVVVGNDRAVRAYERLGFEDTGVRVPHPVTSVMTELQMRRRA
jgi:RimJ/RimL family protein N-acetyltransferase